MKNKLLRGIHFFSPVRTLSSARFVTCVLLAVLVSNVGCARFYHFLATGGARKSHHPDPLKDWKFSESQDPNRLDKTIRDDYQDYIEKLPHEERRFVGSIHLFEGGTGQNAVKIEVNLWGTRWEHVLIYDNAHKRTKVIKYVGGRYRS